MSAVPSTPAPAPETEIEAFLLDLWKHALRADDIATDSNFFDLGGDSLLAVNLFLEIERQTGIHLPITAIYDAPTIAEMARLIETEADPQSSCLVLLKPGTGNNPLYIVHGIGGTVIELASLGRLVGIPDAVYAIQARGLDGREAPLATIEAMADHYVDAVRAIQPRGPYRLCGHSFGGLVAMEMARRLRARGQSIGALILMDSYAHPSTWPLFSRAKMRVRRSLHLLGRSLGRSPAETLSDLSRRFARRDETVRLHDWLLDQNPSLPAPLLRVREAGGAALRAWSPKAYAGPVIFLSASRRDVEFPDDPKRIWRRIALDVQIRTIPGAHRTIVTRHAETAAAALTECLNGCLPRVATVKRERPDDGAMGIATARALHGAMSR